MKADDLQDLLARLLSGETLLLPAADVEQAFASDYPTPEERRAAVARLAALYTVVSRSVGRARTKSSLPGTTTYSS